MGKSISAGCLFAVRSIEGSTLKGRIWLHCVVRVMMKGDINNTARPLRTNAPLAFMVFDSGGYLGSCGSLGRMDQQSEFVKDVVDGDSE